MEQDIKETFQKYSQRGVKKDIEQDATALHVACYNGQAHIVSFLQGFPQGGPVTPGA